MPGALGVPAKIEASRGGCKLVVAAIVGSLGVYVVVKVKDEFGLMIRYQTLSKQVRVRVACRAPKRNLIGYPLLPGVQSCVQWRLHGVDRCGGKKAVFVTLHTFATVSNWFQNPMTECLCS